MYKLKLTQHLLLPKLTSTRLLRGNLLKRSVHAFCTVPHKNCVFLSHGPPRWLTTEPRTRLYYSENLLPRRSFSRKADEEDNRELATIQTTKRLSRHDRIMKIEGEVLGRPEPPTFDEWEEIGQRLGTLFTNPAQWPSIFMKILTNHCCTGEVETVGQVAKSLLEYTRHIDANSAEESTSRFNVPLLTNYMRICGHHLADSGHENIEIENTLTETFSQLRDMTRVLDSESSLVLIRALSSARSLWKHTLTILDDFRDVSSPSPAMLTPIIAAGFRFDEPAVALDLLTELALIEQERPGAMTVPKEISNAVLSKTEENGDLALVSRLLRNMITHRWLLLESDTRRLINCFDSIEGEQWKGTLTKMSVKGVCENCQKKLPSEHLTGDEFAALRDSFMKKCLKREDIFLNTSPEELHGFQEFLESNSPFDLILDGLNIAFQLGKHKRQHNAFQLLQVVKSLASGRRILVLGRRHMKNWHAKHMAQIKSLAKCFFAENVSSDDPFMLYAAFHSGPQALVVTCDMMRDHRALLQPEMQQHFNTWQRTHQVTFTASRTHNHPPLFQWPTHYDTRVQCSDRGWHIPYEDDIQRASHELPNAWICLQSKT